MDQIKLAFLAFTLIFASSGMASAQTSAVTYQGELKEGGVAATGTFEMQFKLFDALNGGSQVGSTITNNSVAVSSGIFSVVLDFGAPAFSTGADRFLEIGVHKPSDPPGFTLLSPRQPLTSSPYSLRTVSASSADSLSASCVSCVADANIDAISGAKVTGTVANATNAATAASVSGVVPIANGGTGSATKNFVDLSTAQTIAGNKTFSGTVTIGSLNASLGQSASTVFGTSSITITPSAALTVIPGLTQTVNVPTGYKAYLVAGGGLSTISGSTTGFSVVDIAFVIDGMVTPEGNYRRVIAANTTGIVNVVAYWNISSTISLTPGSHNIEVRAAGVGSGFNATVSGDSNSILQSDLTVILIKN